MIIKIGKFNFVSENKEEFRLFQDNSYSMFSYFYMDGKEDTLYVHSRSDFDKENKEYYKFEQELLKRYYILEYSSLIHNRIQKFISDKTFEIFKNNNYSSYELYKDISIRKLQSLDTDIKCSLSYNTKINFNTSKLVYALDNGDSIIFDPYTEEIHNLEELYKKGLFDNEIKAGLILKEIQHKKAPKFILKLAEINTFLKEKKNVNLIFNDGNKIKTEAELDEIFNIYGKKISLHSSNELENLNAVTFNKSEVTINSEDFSDIEKQIIRTTEDIILHKVDQLKEELKDKFDKYRNETEYYMPDTIKECIERITTLEKNNFKIEQEQEKEKYPGWYSKEFTNLWQDYERIKTLENIDNLEDIKDEAIKTEDEELKKIYYMFGGEEDEESEEL
ncbi:MAG: hypothetical protein HFJ53_03105 [Clostridia bacterium]|jgi:hypothetical protein|nr:hypothetical protein [Clostridia bacterium]